MLILIWVQTVWKGSQQTAKVTASKERINDPPYNVMSFIDLFSSLIIFCKQSRLLYLIIALCI